jgi:hypothetical protein
MLGSRHDHKNAVINGNDSAGMAAQRQVFFSAHGKKPCLFPKV